MRRLITIPMLLIISVSCYAQGVQESYTLLMLDFENRSGIENPLLAMFSDAIDFGLSRQTGPIQVRMVPGSLRDAFMARATAGQPDLPARSLETGARGARYSRPEKARDRPTASRSSGAPRSAARPPACGTL